MTSADHPRPGSSVPRLHVVTDERVLTSASFAERAKALLERGGPRLALHVRGREVPAARLFSLAETLAEPSRRVGALLVVNDRVDIALAAKADGVQLGWRSLPIEDARAIAEGRLRLGASIHGAPEASRAERAGADWIFAGTVFPSRSHPGGEPCGLEGLTACVDAAPGTPVMGIGGIEPSRVHQVLATGAHGVAVIRGIWDAADPAGALVGYLDALAEQTGER